MGRAGDGRILERKYVRRGGVSRSGTKGGVWDNDDCDLVGDKVPGHGSIRKNDGRKGKMTCGKREPDHV